MGFRTVVILYNDQASTWEKDPNLGKKISWGMNDPQASDLGYGKVVECVHADVQTLIAFDSYTGHLLSTSHWHRNQKEEDMALKLLQEAADKLGYRLHKKPAKKEQK